MLLGTSQRAVNSSKVVYTECAVKSLGFSGQALRIHAIERAG